MTNYTQWKSLVDLHEYSAIPDSAIHQWRMAEGSGTTTDDEIADNDLDLLNGDGGDFWITDSDLEGGQGIELSGQDERLRGNTISHFEPGENAYSFGITVELDNTDHRGVILMHDLDGDADNVTAIEQDNGELRFRTGFEGDVGTSLSDGLDTTDRVRILVTVDEDMNRSFYRNGNELTPDGDNAGSVEISGDLTIGKEGTRDRRWLEAVVDNPIAYDEELSSSEAESDYLAQPWS